MKGMEFATATETVIISKYVTGISLTNLLLINSFIDGTGTDSAMEKSKANQLGCNKFSVSILTINFFIVKIDIVVLRISKILNYTRSPGVC